MPVVQLLTVNCTAAKMHFGLLIKRCLVNGLHTPAGTAQPCCLQRYYTQAAIHAPCSFSCRQMRMAATTGMICTAASPVAASSRLNLWTGECTTCADSHILRTRHHHWRSLQGEARFSAMPRLVYDGLLFVATTCASTQQSYRAHNLHDHWQSATAGNHCASTINDTTQRWLTVEQESNKPTCMHRCRLQGSIHR
jgi:hypothetical protein